MNIRKVSVFKKEGRKSPWGVRYWLHAGKPVVKFFGTKEMAEVYATELRDQFRAHAAGDADLPGQQSHTTFSQIWKSWIKEQKNRGLRKETVNNYIYEGKYVASLFPKRHFEHYKAEDIKTTIIAGSAKHANSVYMGKRYWAILQRLYKHAGKQPPIVNWNWPVSDEEEVTFMDPETVEKIITSAPDRLKAGYALMFFAGVRVHEILRLGDANINRIDRMVRIPAASAKTRRTRVLTGLPKNLWDILDKYPLVSYGFECNMKYHRGELKRQGINWVRNGARHSFATYHVAWKGYNNERQFNLHETSDILGHKNGLDLLNTHYRGITDSQQADRYFRICLAEKPSFLQLETV